MSELARAHDLGDALHALCVAVGTIDADQPVGFARCIDDGLRLRRVAPERLLAEHRRATQQCADRLLRMHCAWRRDDDAVGTGVENLVEAADNLCTRRELLCLARHGGRGVGNRNDVRNIGFDDGLHAMAADPTYTEESETRPRHGMTNAFKNSPGRSRVASRALSS